MNPATQTTIGIILATIGAVIMAVVILATVATLAALLRGRSAWGGDTCPSCQHPMDDHRGGRCTQDCGCRLDPWGGLSFSQSEEKW